MYLQQFICFLYESFYLALTFGCTCFFNLASPGKYSGAEYLKCFSESLLCTGMAKASPFDFELTN